MTVPSIPKRFAIIGGGLLLVVLIFVICFVNGWITTWVEGPEFRAMLDQETSKGLKLEGSFAPLQRRGVLGLSSDSFMGANGYKTIVTLQAYDISGTFNPLGVLLRRWEIDSIRINSGSVSLQETEASGAEERGPPWWAFWPTRVYLADVKVDDANILWKLRDQDSGIYDTQLEITPNGRDFEYDAHDGDFRMPMTPPLKVVHAHLLVRKPRVYCSEFILADDAAHPTETIQISGDAGLQQDRSIHLKIDLDSLQVAPWLPEKLRPHVEGQASGHFDYASSGTGLETGQGKGNITVTHAILRDLQLVHQYTALTGGPNPGDMALKVCRADLGWDKGAVSASNIEAECEGVFRLTGTVTITADHTLSGQIELGLTDPYLRWLPTARTAIFTRDEGPYHFTTIHLSGTVQKPDQDLTPRIARELEKSPMLALKLFFRQAGQWFDFN
jgi:hypothetical protein